MSKESYNLTSRGRNAAAVALLGTGAAIGIGLNEASDWIGDRIEKSRTFTTIEYTEADVEAGKGAIDAVCSGLGEIATKTSIEDLDVNDFNCVEVGQSIGGIVHPGDQISVRVVENGNGKLSLQAEKAEN